MALHKIQRVTAQISVEFHVSIPEDKWDEISNGGDIDIAVMDAIKSRLIQYDPQSISIDEFTLSDPEDGSLLTFEPLDI